MCAVAVVEGRGAGVQKSHGLRGKRFRPLLRDPEVLDLVALVPDLRVGVLFSSGVELTRLGLLVAF